MRPTEHRAPRDRLGEPQLESPRVLLARGRAAREHHAGRREHQRDDDIVETALEIPGGAGEILEAKRLEKLRRHQPEHILDARSSP